MRTNSKRWTKAEDKRLLRQVKAFPQNLSKCFVLVGEEIGRSRDAVALHWYNKLSKDPSIKCFFTASPKHVSKNRKNSMAERSNVGIWRRILSIIGW